MAIKINNEALNSYHVQDDLYRVPLEAIQYASFEVHGFQNPRTILMGTDNSPEHINGFSPEEMEELKESIKANGLIHNLAVWYHNGELILLCGERRRRAIDLLIENDEEVKSSKKPDAEFLPASEVYEHVIVKVVRGTLQEAQRMAFQENEEAKNIGDGATVAYVGQLKQQGYSEADIVAITNKSITWIHETIGLMDLDPETYGKLLRGEINRSAAKALSKISDVSERLEKIEKANESAKERLRELQRRQEDDVRKAQIDADVLDIQHALGEADEQAKREALEKLQQKRRELTATTRRRPQIKVADLRNVDKNKSDALRKPLTHAKVRAKFRKPCEEMLEKGEFPDGISQASAETVVLLGQFVEDGNIDVVQLLQKIEAIHAKADAS